MRFSPDSWILESIDPPEQGGRSNFVLIVPGSKHRRGRSFTLTVFNISGAGYETILCSSSIGEGGDVTTGAAFRFGGKVIIAT